MALPSTEASSQSLWLNPQGAGARERGMCIAIIRWCEVPGFQGAAQQQGHQHAQSPRDTHLLAKTPVSATESMIANTREACSSSIAWLRSMLRSTALVPSWVDVPHSQHMVFHIRLTLSAQDMAEERPGHRVRV